MPVFKPRNSDKSYTLPEAGRLARDLAEREQLPLARVARTSPPTGEHFFAASILSVVGGEGLRRGETIRSALTRADLNGLSLSDDMTVLTGAESADPVSTDLRISKADFARYMGWARTVL
jgi:hypothetical protein